LVLSLTQYARCSFFFALFAAFLCVLCGQGLFSLFGEEPLTAKVAKKSRKVRKEKQNLVHALSIRFSCLTV
jgi:hypothetical protein